ncbi:cache domain-containing sensor histidine kinase [Gorillibacterium sp. sgz5001074]|uniref:cache domain-containing sensor histidine kinase n=1 Tax=Gorillibacterium sp. sgz5001074 TaxID=3446695 RepID=UPI003F679034
MFRIRGSIRNKLILFMLIATIVPIVTSIAITYKYTKESVKRTALQENSNLLFQGKTNLIHYFNLMDQATLSAYSDYKFFNILQRGYENNRDDQSQLLAGIQNMFRSINETYQVHLDPVKSKEHFIYTHGRFLNSAKPEKTEDGEGPFKGYQAYLEPTHWSHDYSVTFFPKYDPVPVITYHRPIFNVPASDRLGLLSIDILPTFIERISAMLYNQDHEDLYLLDPQGVVVYSSKQEDWGKVLNKGWVSHLLAMEGERGAFEWVSDGFSGMEIFEKLETPYMNWTLVKQIPYDHLYKNARDLAGINVAVFTLFLVVVIAATVYISIRFTAPVRLLISTINKIQTGQLNVDIDVKGSDEIGILARRFRLMMQTINELILREYALELANKTNELKALQAQINPHFLNNALQSIGTLALQHQEVKIYSLIASLGKMMRYHMNTNETVVPLSKEIDYVKGYLELQQQRFDERLQVELEAAPDSLAVKLPKMTLQPIVENFFKHGYDTTREGRIRIECSLTEGGEALRITVADNGKGMEEEELKALSSKLEQDPSFVSEGQISIGLLNVIQRIKLYFNENARMNVSHAEPTGLRVELHIPLADGGKPQ